MSRISNLPMARSAARDELLEARFVHRFAIAKRERTSAVVGHLDAKSAPRLFTLCAEFAREVVQLAL